VPCDVPFTDVAVAEELAAGFRLRLSDRCTRPYTFVNALANRQARASIDKKIGRITPPRSARLSTSVEEQFSTMLDHHVERCALRKGREP
jgi:hypothetical protein